MATHGPFVNFAVILIAPVPMMEYKHYQARNNQTLLTSRCYPNKRRRMPKQELASAARMALHHLKSKARIYA
jgi:hypothetical protein